MTKLFTRRETIGLGLAFALTPALLRAQEIHDVQIMSMGPEDAPVTMVEYASFTCPHCANFHLSVLPRVKENFIDEGKVRLVYREVYFDRPSLWASMIARCAPRDRFFGVVDVLYRQQQDWATSPNPEEMVSKLYAIGRQAGLTNEEMDSCMQDRPFAEALVAEFQKNAQADQIEATPTFVINGTKQENVPYDELAAKLEEAAAGN